jgi:hypothetical protein
MGKYGIPAVSSAMGSGTNYPFFGPRGPRPDDTSSSLKAPRDRVDPWSRGDNNGLAKPEFMSLLLWLLLLLIYIIVHAILGYVR